MRVDRQEDMYHAGSSVIGLLLLVGLQAASGDIVVSGQRLDEAFAQCAARRCTPLRDAQVSVAKAEQLIRDGRYLEAKRRLADAVVRNRRYAATDPKPLAALYEAYATVSWQEGDQITYRQAVAGQVRTLREHLPPTDPAVVDSEIALGDMWMKLREFQVAGTVYDTAERHARELKHERTAVSAAIRRAWLAVALRRPEQARAIMARVEQSPLATDPQVRSVLPVIRMRVAVADKDEAAIDRLVSRLAGQDAAGAPRLVWSPPLQMTAAQSASKTAQRWGERDGMLPHSSEVRGISWADVGFWVRPDGRTEQVEVLRGTRGADWTRPVLAQIEERRYGALTGTTADTGVYRIERYTMRGTYQIPIGSLIRRRSGVPSIEMLDLTDGSKTPRPLS